MFDTWSNKKLDWRQRNLRSSAQHRHLDTTWHITCMGGRCPRDVVHGVDVYSRGANNWWSSAFVYHVTPSAQHHLCPDTNGFSFQETQPIEFLVQGKVGWRQPVTTWRKVVRSTSLVQRRDVSKTNVVSNHLSLSLSRYFPVFLCKIKSLNIILFL